MAVTGFLLFGFVVAHMLGNLQIFFGQDAINDYAHHLKSLPMLLWPARIFLLTVLTAHVFVSINLARQNRAARPVRYAHADTVQASYASRTMVISGLIVFAFIVYHLLHLTYGIAHPEFFHLIDSKGRDDVYSRIVLSFRNYFISGAYIFAMFLLCQHLGHGLSSLFQSLGLNRTRYNSAIGMFGNVFATIIFIGNVSIPAAVLLNWIPLPGKDV